MTPFVRRVLTATMQVPAGNLVSYGDIARRIGGCSGFHRLIRVPETNHFHRQPVGSRIRRIHHVDVVVFPVPARGGVGQPLTAARPPRPGVPRPAIGQQRDSAILGIVTVKLVKLASALVLREDDHLTRLRPEQAAGDRFGQEGQLPARSARHPDQVQL